MDGLHRGETCRHLRRHKSDLMDCRCSMLMEQYAQSSYAFLDSQAWVSPCVAAEVLSLPASVVIEKAKKGEMAHRHSSGVSRRTVIDTTNGTREVTLLEATKQLGIPLAELERRIETGQQQAYYKDEHLEIAINQKWAYEKCPLWKSAGVCYHYLPACEPALAAGTLP